VTNTDTDPVVNLRRFETRSKEVVVAKARTELLQGTLDMLILKTLALGPMHGWGISQRIAQISEDVLQVYQGSLYPALQRLETAGWIDSEWGASDNNRQARFYRLTRKGQKQLRDETANWERMTGAVAKILSAES
jgi:PadR family transcriptional regulator PadR